MPSSSPKVEAIFDELEAEGRAALKREFGEGAVTIEREAEMRYKGQQHSIKIRIAEDDDAARLRARFDQEYLRRYGHANATAEAQIVVLHSLATLHMKQPEIARLARANGAGKTPSSRSGRSTFLRRTASCRHEIYDRYALGPGFAGRGPALIVEYGSSTLIGPGDTFQIGKLGEIDIDCHH